MSRRELCDMVAHRESDNTALRSIAQEMWRCVEWSSKPHAYMMDGCDHCPHRHNDCGLSSWKRRLREIGVEC